MVKVETLADGGTLELVEVDVNDEVLELVVDEVCTDDDDEDVED